MRESKQDEKKYRMDSLRRKSTPGNRTLEPWFVLLEMRSLKKDLKQAVMKDTCPQGQTLDL